MKKMAWVVLVFWVGAAQAQTSDFSKFKIGFKGNANFSWMSPNDNHVENMGSKVNFGYGLICDIHFTENYAFGTGVNIESAGGELKYIQEVSEGGTSYLASIDRTYKMRYIEVPVTLKMRTTEIGYITYWGQFGVGLGANIGAHADDHQDYLQSKGSGGVWSPSDKPSVQDDKINVSDDVQIFRAALIIGAGIEYNLSGSTSLVAGISYNNGFTNALKGEVVKQEKNGDPVFNGNDPQTVKLSANNSYVAISIGLLF